MELELVKIRCININRRYLPLNFIKRCQFGKWLHDKLLNEKSLHEKSCNEYFSKALMRRCQKFFTYWRIIITINPKEYFGEKLYYGGIPGKNDLLLGIHSIRNVEKMNYVLACFLRCKNKKMGHNNLPAYFDRIILDATKENLALMKDYYGEDNIIEYLLLKIIKDERFRYIEIMVDKINISLEKIIKKIMEERPSQFNCKNTFEKVYKFTKKLDVFLEEKYPEQYKNIMKEYQPTIPKHWY
jgi:hypothetical protein